MDNFSKNDDVYDPNFSIDGSNTEKLDMYGVWLKKKKDAVEPNDTDISETSNDSELQKEQSDINFDDEFSFSSSFSDIDDDIPDLDELTIESDEKNSEMTSDTEDSDLTDSSADEDMFETLDLDDFLDDDNTVTTDQTDAGISFDEEEPLDLDFDDTEDTMEDSEKSENSDVPPAELENFGEISLEDFEDASSDKAIETADEFETIEDFDDILADEEAENEEYPAAKREEYAPLDINVTVDDETDKMQRLTESSAQTIEDNADIPIFGETGDKSDFDDIEATKQKELSPQHSVERSDNVQEKGTMDTTVTATSQTSTIAQDKATELLMKIAHEISDLKAELNQLKVGFAAQSGTLPVTAPKTPSHHQEEKSEETGNSGFFSDDDTDETIALTGDELNNILITADFTEEKQDEEDSPGQEDYEAPPVLTEDTQAEKTKDTIEDADFEASIMEPAAEASDGAKILDSDPAFNAAPTSLDELPEDLSYLDDKTDISDEESNFENIEIGSFDIPSEQEIEVPQSITDQTHTIHELQTDKDFGNPFSASSTPELKAGIESTTGIDNDIPELEVQEDENADSTKQETLLQAATRKREQTVSIPVELKNEIKSVLAYMDQLLEALPEQKIEEFAKSEYFETYKHLFEELGIS